MNIRTTTAVSVLAIALASGGSALAADVELDFVVSEGEYEAQFRAILDLYEEENPSVKVNLSSVNEDTEAAFAARIAAGDAPDIRNMVFPDQDNYQTYVNLRARDDIEHFGTLSYDGLQAFEGTTGIEGVQPTLNVRTNPFRSFVYYVDEFEKAGLDPKSIENLADLESLLADLKAYVDATDGVDIVIDAGWLPGAWGRFNPEVWGVGFGATKQEVRDLYGGKIRWDDMENNPLVTYFEKLKVWYEKGYMPERWWTRNWEQDFEASFIARRSILTFHGPWIWDKVQAVDPDAQLDGFYFPPNRENKIWGPEVTSDYGSVLYAQNEGSETFEESIKLFNWWNSPSTVKLRAEAIGFVPSMDLSSVGGADLVSDQYVKIIKPVKDGQWLNGASFDHSLCGRCEAERFRISGTPRPLQDNQMAEIYADYLEGRVDLQATLDILQERWERAYDVK